MSASSMVFRGFFVLPKRLASSRSSFSVTATSTTDARSTPGMSALRRSSFSWSAALAVNRTPYRDGANGSTTAGFIGATTGAGVGGVGGSTTPGRSSKMGVGAGVGVGASRRAGSLRIVDGTSGLGATSATNSSIFFLVRCVARAKSSSRFASVRTGASFAIPSQVKEAILEHRQKHWMLPRRPRHGQTQVSLRGRQMKHLGAINKHGR